MKEDFLHYLWRFRLIQTPLYSTTGDKVEVLCQGHYNTDSGPDFIEAKLKVGTTIWAGNVELHLKASDWDRHGHQSDKAYNTVILHVVYQHNGDVKIGETILPVLEIKDFIDKNHYQRFEKLLKAKKTILRN